jgi:Spy/CpxP family protein refolding chaperone
MNRIVWPSSLLAALVAAPLAFASPDGEGTAPCPQAGPGAKAPAGDAGAFARMGGRMRGRFGMRRGARLARLLGLTDAQREDFLKTRQSFASVREDLRTKIRAVREEAKKGEATDATRAATHEKIKALVAAARDQVAPEARRLMGTLTPEQRARLDEIAARHGKTFDDARLLKLIERGLLRPRFGHRRAGPDAKATSDPKAGPDAK